jgi:hypothetical protein
MACVNSYRNGKRLRYLVRERKALADLLTSDAERPYVTPIQKGNISNQHVANQLLEHERQYSIIGLHFTGHADESEPVFRIESDKFETPVTRDEISALIGMLPKLQVVFLNGCATEKLVEHLLRKDIPIVIATQTSEEHPYATDLARNFYYYLSQGCTVLEAAQFTSARFPELWSVPVSYDIEQDALHWEGKGQKRFQWGLYYLPENLSRVNQRPPRRPVMSFPASEEDARALRRRRRRRIVRYSLAAIVLGLLAACLTMLIMEEPAALFHRVASF